MCNLVATAHPQREGSVCSSDDLALVQQIDVGQVSSVDVPHIGKLQQDVCVVVDNVREWIRVPNQEQAGTTVQLG